MSLDLDRRAFYKGKCVLNTEALVCISAFVEYIKSIALVELYL
jgi:hypothetical protein